MVLENLIIGLTKNRVVAKFIEAVIFILGAFVLNFLFANVVGISNFNPTLGLTILAGVLYGRSVGLSTGFLSMTLIQFQAGFFVLYQAIPMGLLGLLAGFLFHKKYKENALKNKIPLNKTMTIFLFTFALASVVVYSMISNLVMFNFMPVNFSSVVTIIQGTLIFDLKHLVMTEIIIGIFVLGSQIKKVVKK